MGQVKRAFPELLEVNGADTFEWTYNGTKGGIQLDGNFDGATVTVQVSLNGKVTFITDPNFSLTANGIVYFAREAVLGAVYRFFLAGAGASTAIVPTLIQNNR